MAKRCHIEETALEFAKTLITSDQPELIETAEAEGETTVAAIATVSFELAEAFHAERDRRFGNE
jgi:hypothetical protein